MGKACVELAKVGGKELTELFIVMGLYLSGYLGIEDALDISKLSGSEALERDVISLLGVGELSLFCAVASLV